MYRMMFTYNVQNNIIDELKFFRFTPNVLSRFYTLVELQRDWSEKKNNTHKTITTISE